MGAGHGCAEGRAAHVAADNRAGAIRVEGSVEARPAAKFMAKFNINTIKMHGDSSGKRGADGARWRGYSEKYVAACSAMLYESGSC